jgi:hypothetical protein
MKTSDKRGREMKIKLFLILLLIALGTVLMADIPELRRIENVRSKEAMYNHEIIEEYDFDKSVKFVRLTKPELRDSGTLSIVSLPISPRGGLPNIRYSFDNNLNPTRVGNDSLSLYVSKYGEYFVQQEFGEKEHTCFIHKKNGELVYSFSKEYQKDYPSKYPFAFSIGKINDNGVLTYRISNQEFHVLHNDMTIKKIGPFYEEESLQFLRLGEYVLTTVLSLNGNIAIAATENRNIEPENYHSFPLGARVFFYDERSNFIKSYDIEGTEIPSPNVYSDSGRYFIMQCESYMYLFKDTELVLKEEVGGIGAVRFSEDESVALVGTGVGNLVIDLENIEIKHNLGGLPGVTKAIANIGHPIIATIISNRLYIVNYETEEVILSETVGPKLRGGSTSATHLEVSGDGKTISAFHRKWYRKYRIGGRK